MLNPFKILGNSYLLLILSLMLLVLILGLFGSIYNLFCKCSDVEIVPIKKQINDFKDLEITVKNKAKTKIYELHLAFGDIPDSVIQNVIIGDTLLIKVSENRIFGIKHGDLVVFDEDEKNTDTIKTICATFILVVLLLCFFRFKYLLLKKEFNR
jgi:hypothetical protein